MVSEKAARFACAVRRVLAVLALLSAESACGKIVGITDTVVYTEAGSAGQASLGGTGAQNGRSGAGGTAGATNSAGDTAHGGHAGSRGNAPEAGANSEGGAGGDAGEPASGGTSGAGTSGGTSGTSGAPSGGSAGTAGSSRRGPAPVKIESLEFSYAIDSTEVTVGQYRAFLDAMSDGTADQPEYCSWNDSYSPGPGEAPGGLDDPMTYVDWCDARAFCTWAGARLCGRIGGGAIAKSEFSMSAASQWMRACGGQGESPTVESSDIPTRPCNIGEENLRAAGSTCEGSYNGLFDMVGNAAEWVDACTGGAGASDTCFAAGSSFWDDVLPNSPNGRCDSYDELPRSLRNLTVGFRCCSKD